MSTLVAQTISNGTVSTSSANVIQGSAKAWVNFNGSSAAIRASYNVTSVTKNSTADYTINFTNALVDANYAPVFSTNSWSSTDPGGDRNVKIATNGTNISNGTPITMTTTALRVIVGAGSRDQDNVFICASIFR
jgi:hypothetical protein